jgi:alkylated DNA repair dioxygenase AlkB
VQQPDLFLQDVLPSGLVYVPDAIAAADEQALAARFAELPFKPFEFHGHLGNRRIVSYGARYDYSARRLRDAEPIPDFLFALRDRAAGVLKVPPERIAHALVTEYAPGAGIGWHRDKPEFDEVVAFSFIAPARLRFRRKNGPGWDRRALEVTPRSLYILRGESRTVWEHSIPAVERLRYSVTFRNLRNEPSP